jgi:hypothetical protein
MNNYTKQLQDELKNCGKETIFEVEVIDRDGEQDFITCEVYFKGNSIVAERDAVNQKEWDSRYIATDKLVVDNAFGLDEHLQELYSLVLDSINEGGFFQLA